MKQGPLAGLTVVEMAGLGPVPHAGLMLAELGARVVRIERISREQPFLNLPAQFDLDRHGREILRIDLKQPAGIGVIRRLVASADVLVEGYRPGVMERLGLGPEVLLDANPGIVYARMTGFGQDGPLAKRAGHDLTYLALSGVLHAIGQREGKPVPPLNLVADYGGGTMFLIVGILSALIEKSRSGRGQVVDSAMIDGVSMLAAPFFAFMAAGIWRETRGSNLLDSGAPFYDTYECADGGHIAVACLEPQFFAEFCRLLPLDDTFAAAQYDTSRWPDMREAIADRIRKRTRDEWSERFTPSDACVMPVLSMTEAARHPHNRARAVHVTNDDGFTRPASAPRFSRTPGAVSPQAQRSAAETLAAFGIDRDAFERLVSDGVVGE